MPATAPDRGDEAISAVAHALSSGSTAAALKGELEGLQRHAISYGFDASQCQRLLNLALCGSSSRKRAALNRKPPKASAAASILRSIVPAPGTRLGSDLVYAVLACLGPNPGTKVEADAGISTVSRDDPVDESSSSKIGPDRVKVDIRVQVAAIRLLCVLLDSPPVPLNLAATLEPSEEGAEPKHPSELGGALPTTYLTLAARATLQRCYGVLFHFLDYQALRPHLCYLLCKVTKRKHVKHYRISKLMSLRANFAAETGLSALLSVYANFYPDLLFPELVGGSGSASSVGSNGVPGLKFPDNDWVGRVLRCHARHARRANGEKLESDNDDDDQGKAAAGDRARPAKRARVSLDASTKTSTEIEASKLPLAALPNLVTIQPQTSLNKTLGTLPSLITELSSLRHLAHSLDRLTLPSQVAAMLAPTFGARLTRVAVLSGATITNDVSLSQDGAVSDAKASDYCWVRLSDWLESVVRDEVGLGQSKAGAEGGREQPGLGGGNRIRLPANQSAHNRLASLLLRALQTFDVANEIPSRFEETICQVLRGLADVAAAPSSPWDRGWDALCAEIVSFVPLLKPRSWIVFDDLVIGPLRQLCLAPVLGETAVANIVEALAKMLQRWAKRDWSQIVRRLDRKASVRWGISALDEQVDYFETISHTAATLDGMATEALLRYPRSVVVEHAALSCYEVLAGPLCGLHGVYMISPLAFYAFSCCATSPMPLSRLAGLMQQMRRSHEVHKVPAPGRTAAKHDRVLRTLQADYFAGDQAASLNKAVTVLVNFIWRGKAFDEALDNDAPRLGFDEDVIAELKAQSQERGPGLHLSSSITHHACFANLSDRFLNDYCRRHGTPRRQKGWIRGPVTPRLLQRAKQRGIPADWTSKEYRRHLLDWLGEGGMRGLDDFIKNSLRNYHAAPPPPPPQQPQPQPQPPAAGNEASVTMDV
ncbi:uncharacterized protein PFL1_02245 [Pseudozyma flocculosa PF-1]|uniref:Uncharacterized protein n=1 Tax=Pseudozyma flocculosa TaxID=84751 RepID=A0A5C3FFX6_9BASI|nr:uncharacterized protein PFL1_02245 [Pseudozyma flocculosa PF-1]EPQ30128.1 hypothetical protein PFL1_02245 [Pseudozyma flocculosa PF-1]SPO42259.1 uncharacterized protein PSFLO_07742 [Pseudozyma flocculosa]